MRWSPPVGLCLLAPQILSTAALALLGCTADITGGEPPDGVGSTPTGENPAGSGDVPGGAQAQDCAQQVAAPTLAARIRRLTRLEIENTLSDLLDETSGALARELEADTFAIGYSTGDERGVSSNYVDALKSVAEQAASRLVSAPEYLALGSDCFASETSSSACVRTFIETFGARAWRRPLEMAEVDGLLTVYGAGRATTAEAAERPKVIAGLDYAVRAVLQSSHFIFRTELGQPGASGATVPLAPHEAAATLAYGLIASPPDAELIEEARNNRLSTAEQLGAQGRRLLAARPDRFARQAERFVREWLSIDLESPAWNKDGELYPEATPSLKAALDQETALYLRDWAKGASLETLLTTPRGFVSSDNALVYGLQSTSNALTATDLDPTQRAGVLTLPAFLGSRAHSDASSPVVRGTAILRQLLCREPPPVPAMVPPLPPADQSAAKTTRERFEQHTSVAFCAACHQVFDPMGYPFEHYDAIGRYRDQENGTPIDSSGAIVGTESSDAPVADAIELSALLATSPEVHACFTRQTYRFIVGRKETDADACALTANTQQFETQGMDVRELMLTLLTSPSSLERVPLTPDP
jgi:hypothetical protein